MQNLIHFIFEVETLKSIKRSGSYYARVPVPDSLAEHIALASQIAFLLAEIEGGNSEHCASIMLFHDNAEVRIGDINKVQARYIHAKEAEVKASAEQNGRLPQSLGEKVEALCKEYRDQKTHEAKICKDADLLELAFQAKIFMEQGFKAKQDWIDNIASLLHFQTSKNMLELLTKTDSTDWWKGLKKL